MPWKMKKVKKLYGLGHIPYYETHYEFIDKGDNNMRIIKISKCEDCPYFEYAYITDNCFYVCEHIDVNRKCIDDKTKIQDFCPLEEVE